jgi:cysteinyl-tRNA synthetase
MCDVLGLLYEGYFERKKERWLKTASVTRAEIEALMAHRERARQAKNWNEADRLREELQRKGIVIEDTPGGTLWRVK